MYTQATKQTNLLTHLEEKFNKKVRALNERKRTRMLKASLSSLRWSKYDYHNNEDFLYEYLED